MSEKFLQINIPCKDCLVAPACEEKKTIDVKVKQQELFEFMLTLRRWDETKKSYRKGLIEAWVNMGKDIFNGYRTDEFDGVPNSSTPEYLNVLIELTNTMQWMINSKSWRDGEMHSFDKIDCHDKLKQAIGWI
jgi:hypothetical protein